MSEKVLRKEPSGEMSSIVCDRLELIFVGFEVAKAFALLLEIPEVLIEPLAALGQIGIVNISSNP